MTDDPARAADERRALARDLLSLCGLLLLEPPTAARLAPWRDPDVGDVLGAWFGPRVSVAFASVHAAASVPDPDLDEGFRARLGAPGDLFVPPYESVYVDAEGTPLTDRGRLGGPVSRAVAEAYRAAGWAVARPELPDHAGVELLFAARLLDGKGPIPAASAFHRAHPARFLEPLAARLATRPSGQFLGAIARFADTLLGALDDGTDLA